MCLLEDGILQLAGWKLQVPACSLTCHPEGAWYHGDRSLSACHFGALLLQGRALIQHCWAEPGCKTWGLVFASCFPILLPPTCSMRDQVGLFMPPGWGGDLVLFLLICNVNILVPSTLLGAGCHVEEHDSFMLLLLGAQ